MPDIASYTFLNRRRIEYRSTKLLQMLLSFNKYVDILNIF